MEKLYIAHKNDIKNYSVKIQNIKNNFNSSKRLKKREWRKIRKCDIKNRKNCVIKCGNVSYWDINLKSEYIITTILTGTINDYDYDYDDYENVEDDVYNDDDNDNVDNDRDYYIRKKEIKIETLGQMRMKVNLKKYKNLQKKI